MDFREYFKHIIQQFNLPLESPILVFSLILLIILLSPVLLRKLNIPGIIGLIIAGVVIGPHGLHVLEKNSAIDLFSTIGLLYIMFIAGLELDLNEFKANRNKSLLFGFFTFAIPLSIGYPVCHYLLGYDFNTSLLTASMFATHTLVAYPIVSKFGIAKNQAVAVTVGGTILTDTAVLIILAVILGNSQGSLTSDFWIRLGVSLVIFSLIMFLIIPRIAKWFFKKLESEKHSHYIFVLSVVFFAAFLAEAAGIEPIIGAFVAGLALNTLIPNSSALMNRIEFIGNSLFIPFFLISVGMIVNIKVIMSGPTALIVAATLSVVAILGKWLGALFTQLIFKYSKAQRQLIFGLSGAHAAATLAVILVGFQQGIINENILNGTIILILITCIVASFATEKAAKQIVIESENDHSEIQKQNGVHNEHILLPISDLEKIEKLLEFSIFIKDKKSANPISILSVVSNDDEAEVNIIKTRNKLEAFVKQASASETKVNVITTIDHNSASGISRISRELMADIVTMGWYSKTHIIDKLMGEKLESILKNIDKTVMICHFGQPLALHKRLVVAVPRMAEFEKGFALWVKKLAMLAQELSMSILVYCCESTERAIKKVFTQHKLSPSLQFKSFVDWDDFLIISKDVRKDDLFVLISARKGATSYIGALDNLPSKIEKYFEKNNRIVIYPQEYDSVPIERFSDISGEPINKGLEAVQKIGKGIGSIFKKQDEE
ncbi:MAG: cation:proton antiporter [Bacteroidia bacterium]|nr:cation:proton antiporter [Bacteroidia bacterium]